jgi:hypothetical protein
MDREAAIGALVLRMLSEDTRPAPAIWVGALEPWWAWEGNVAGRVILSARRLHDRPSKSGRGMLRRAEVPVFLDSGAFSELTKHDRWAWPVHEFADFVRAACKTLGRVEHAGIQDWMCEPHMLAKTGLTVEEHQRRTVANFCLLRRCWPSVPWLPTLQGHTVAEYMRCAQMYRDQHVELDDHALVGLGSVCRRSGTLEIEHVIREVKAGLPARTRLHGFGVKSEGSLLACWGLASVDSMAWSRRARGMEQDLRVALGLPVDAPSDLVMTAAPAALDAIDMDLADFWEWKREVCPKTAAVSLEFAEAWRMRQTMALAAKLVDEILEQPAPTGRSRPAALPIMLPAPMARAEQLGLW